jgi:hypothetical protein
MFFILKCTLSYCYFFSLRTTSLGSQAPLMELELSVKRIQRGLHQAKENLKQGERV